MLQTAPHSSNNSRTISRFRVRTRLLRKLQRACAALEAVQAQKKNKTVPSQHQQEIGTQQRVHAKTLRRVWLGGRHGDGCFEGMGLNLKTVTSR